MLQPAFRYPANAPDIRPRQSSQLHIAVAVDGPAVPAWVSNLICDVAASSFTGSLCLLFVAKAGETRPEAFEHLLFRKYCRWDDSRLPPDSNPLRLVNLPSFLLEGHADEQPPTDSEPDLLLWLSSHDPGDYPLVRYRHGLWLYRHGTEHGMAGEAEYFWELYHRRTTAASALDILLPGRGRLRVAESYSSTEIGWSLGRSRSVPYWKAARVILSSLRRFSENKTGFLNQATRVPRTAPRVRLPTNTQMLKFGLQNAARTLQRRLLYSHQEPGWFIAYRTETEDFVSETGKFHPSGFRRLATPNGHFYADPFVQSWRGKNYLFFEDYVHSLQRGVICVMECDQDGPKGQAKRILDLPYHLSYPFVFEDAGRLFMIPETLESKRIELYTAGEPFGPWRLARVLQENVAAADTTLWVEDGRYYFFTNLASIRTTPNEELHLFYSDGLEGKWRPHPCNPVSCDIRSSRGAGKLFRLGNRLIRPSQDCSVRYGYACQLNSIEVLSTSEYREEPLLRIEPNWMPGLIGTHTLNSVPGLEVMDGQLFESRYSQSGESLIARCQTGLRGLAVAHAFRNVPATSDKAGL